MTRSKTIDNESKYSNYSTTLPVTRRQTIRECVFDLSASVTLILTLT